MLTEVDWIVLFSSFFSNARIKIMCKNPAKVPKERVFELGGTCYQISFLTEGVTQIDDPVEDGKGDDGKGDDGSPKEDDGAPIEDGDLEDDDLLDDELSGSRKQDGEKGKENIDKGNSSQPSGKKVSQGSQGGTCKSQKTKSVRRSPDFLESFNEISLE